MRTTHNNRVLEHNGNGSRAERKASEWVYLVWGLLCSSVVVWQWRHRAQRSLFARGF